MNNTNYKKYMLWTVLLCTLLTAACHKKEYQVPEQGEKVPYSDSITTKVQQMIEQTSGPLFAAIWAKSEIATLLEEIDDGKGTFTVLRPQESALVEAGWTTAKIQMTDKEELVDLLKMHLIDEGVAADALQRKTGSFKVESMYRYPNLGYTIDQHPLHALLSLDWQSDKLLVNGKHVGSKSPSQAANGYIYDIDTVITPPTQTAWQVIVANPDFSIYVGILQATDAQYREIFRDANGYYPEEGSEIEQLYNRVSYMNYTMGIYTDLAGDDFVWDLNTYFIPSNEAFHAAGFHSVQDLMDFNERRGLPNAIWQEASGPYPAYYGIEGEFATDSLLDFHHNWGFRFVKDYSERKYNNIFLFHNDLQSAAMHNLTIGSYTIPVYSGDVLVRTETSYYRMPFSFEGNQLRLKGANSSSGIIDGDIVTLNGVLHAVDKLIIPPDFNLQN